MPRTICGDFHMRIARDGSWHYQGSPIGRRELVCLFASVLKRDEEGVYWLETPVEKGRVEVEDAPFVAVELNWGHCCSNNDGVCEGGGAPARRRARQCLTFRTNLDEMVTADEAHPIRVQIDPVTREPRPYVTVRPGLEARISRPVFYELVALAQTEVIDGREVTGVWSEGVFFVIDDSPPEDDMPDGDLDDPLAALDDEVA
ncbi:DUF1285 domain-containing protein [Muricoccus vinaceus]|uniref:DUF1285 domain-containing protein n=1 Tax=Muricoccus vinaceus TaxID=424704 RepID=A0ABV6IPY5_9PROT